MFNLIKGAKIPNIDGLTEAYATEENYFIASVSAENIRRVFDKFIEQEGETYYTFWVENPANEEQEKMIQEATGGAVNVTNGGHMETYYMDTLAGGIVESLLNSVSDVFINDGQCRFGITSQRGNEIGKYEYNEMKGYSQDGDMTSFINVMNEMGIREDRHLKTGWDYVSEKTPGECLRYTGEDGKTVDSIIKGLKELGMYNADDAKAL